MRVMIVEDQQLILAGLHRMLTDELPCDAEMMLSAEDALTRIATGPAPDVIVTDIVMAGMNGLDFIREAQKMLPFCRFLIVSGHDSFAFAQKAIQLGVQDYLLKPIERRRLIGAIESIGAELERRNRDLAEACVNAFRLIQSSGRGDRQRFIQHAVYSGFAAGFYCVRGAEASPERGLPGCYRVATMGSAALYLLLLPRDRFDAVHDRLLACVPEKAISFGVDGEGDLNRALQRCVEADDNRFFAGMDAAPFPGELLLRRIDDAMAAREDAAVCLAATEALQALKTMSGPAFVAREFVVALMDRLLERDRDFDVARAWRDAPSYASFLERVREALEQWDGATHRNTIIDQLRRYIGAHSAQPLNVRILADAVGLSPNYASMLFKRETGEALSAFIRRRQLEAARRLLLTTDMRVYEIAEQMGYADEKYFSALFRAAYHISPNELRRSRENPQNSD